MNNTLSHILENKSLNADFKKIAEKVISGERITTQEGIRLFDADLSFLGSLANFIREKKHQNFTYFNRNIHIEPTNICVFDCKFCSYSKLLKHKTEGWELSEEDIIRKMEEYRDQPITEVHIVGGFILKWAYTILQT